jgi:hypothetical protein
MKVKDLLAIEGIKSVNTADAEREITSVYCGDLLSIVMSKAPADSAWVTVMGNVNSVAVATLAEISVIILAENAVMDSVALEKAVSEEINVLRTEHPVFETALNIYNGLNNG